MQFSPDGEALASGSFDKEICEYSRWMDGLYVYVCVCVCMWLDTASTCS